MRYLSTILTALALLFTVISALPSTPDTIPDTNPSTDPVPVIQLTTPAIPADPNTAYCGYVYQYKGLRGGNAALAAGQFIGFGVPVLSGIVSNGCRCAFYA